MADTNLGEMALDETLTPTLEDSAAFDSLMDTVESPGITAPDAPATEKPEAQVVPPIDAPKGGEAIPDVPRGTEERDTTESLAQKQAAEAEAAKKRKPVHPSQLPPAPLPPKPNVTPAAPSTPPAAPAVDPLKEIEKKFPTPKNLSPEGKVNWAELRKAAATTPVLQKELETVKAQAVTLQQQMATLKAAPAAMPEAMKKEYEALKDFRFHYDIQNDPEFKATYDQKIEGNITGAYDLLRKHKLPETFIDDIRKAGGLLDAVVPVVDAVSRQTTQIPLLDSPWWKAEIEGKLPYAERTRLKALIDNSILLADGRARAIDGMVAKRGEYEAKQQAHNQQVTEQTNGIMFNRLEEMRKGMDWAQPITPKGTETPEELATIEAHNNDFKVHEERFNKALNPPDPLTRVETAAAAVLAFKLQDVLEKSVEEFNGKEAAYKNEIANLQKQLGKFVKAGSTSRAAAAAPVNGKPANQANRYQMKDEDAFEALAQEVGI